MGLYVWTHESWCVVFFFFNDTATTEIYTLSLHDALPISSRNAPPASVRATWRLSRSRSVAPNSASSCLIWRLSGGDRKSTRLNSSHVRISYAVFCLKKNNLRIHSQSRLTER